MQRRAEKLLDQVRDAVRRKHYPLSAQWSYICRTKPYILQLIVGQLTPMQQAVVI